MMGAEQPASPQGPRQHGSLRRHEHYNHRQTHHSPGQVQDVVARHLDCPLRQHPGSTGGKLQQLGIVLLLCGIALPFWIHLQAQREARSCLGISTCACAPAAPLGVAGKWGRGKP